MKAVGIIVEYNPLHFGHLHHIEETRRLSHCDVLIAVMSGNFTQRGEPAMIDKFTRTKMALSNHVDLVVELPFVFSVQGADIFSKTAIHILHHLGVSEVYFGSESGDIKALETICDIQERDSYNLLVRQFMNEGNSYPTANDLAMKSFDITAAYDAPNNILGIQYIKAARLVSPPIDMFTIKRINSDYYGELDTSTTIQSASSIRKLLEDKQDIKNYVPSSVYDLLMNRKIVTLNDFTEQLKYIINRSSKEELHDISHISEGLENRILKMTEFQSVDELIELLLTRRYTNSHIKRALIHILCNTKASMLDSFDIPYLRILGMNDTGKEYLNIIKKNVTIPLITKIKGKKHPYLVQELQASKVYSLVSDTDIHKQEFEPVIFLHFN